MLFAALALPAAALADSPPPTLSGEHFAGTFSESVGNCDTLPNPAIHYHVSGIATGPYPGTFNETGTIVISLTAPAVVPLVDVDAHFTIDSPTGQVEGDKHFVATSTGIGQCYEVGGPATKLKTAKADDLDYRAVISTGLGARHRYVDCGTSDLFFTQNTTLPPIEAFGEGFLSSLATVEREHPRGGPKTSACG
jgi:hypothetical protein